MESQKKNLKNLKRKLFGSFFLLAVVLGFGASARAQSNASYDVCDDAQDRQFLHDTGNVLFHSYSPRTAGSGQVITITGEHFNTLPATGTLIRFMGMDFNGNNKAAWVPVMILSDTQMQVQIPSANNSVQIPSPGSNTWFLRDTGLLNPGEYSVTNMDLTYTPSYPNLNGCGEDVRSANFLLGVQAIGNPFPSPSNFRAIAKSDTGIAMTWDYDARHPVDGFRVYMHWCKKTPFDDCRSHNPYDYDLNETMTLNGRQERFWTELTNPQQLLDKTRRAEPVYAAIEADPPSFAGSVIHLAMTAYSRNQGESTQFSIATVDNPEAYGCYNRVQSPRSAANYQVTVRHVSGVDPVNRQPILSPFPGQTLPSVQFTGIAQASYDGNGYPIVDYYGFRPAAGAPMIPPGALSDGDFPFSESLPYRHDALTFGNPSNPRMALQVSRGYGSVNQGALRANIAIDGRFANQDPNTGRHEEFYAAAHLFFNHHDLPDYNPNLQDNTIYVVELKAGQAMSNQPDTIGMISFNPVGNITQLRLPTANAAGSLSGSVRSMVYYFQTESLLLPGDVTVGGDGQPDFSTPSDLIHWFQSDVEIGFNNLPLYNDECQ